MPLNVSVIIVIITAIGPVVVSRFRQPAGAAYATGGCCPNVYVIKSGQHIVLDKRMTAALVARMFK